MFGREFKSVKNFSKLATHKLSVGYVSFQKHLETNYSKWKSCHYLRVYKMNKVLIKHLPQVDIRARQSQRGPPPINPGSPESKQIWKPFNVEVSGNQSVTAPRGKAVITLYSIVWKCAQHITLCIVSCQQSANQLITAASRRRTT